MKPKTQSILAFTLFSFIVVVGLILWPRNAEGSLVVLISVAVMSAVWASVRWMHTRKGCEWMESKSRREIMFAINLASVLLLGSITATLFKEFDMINADTTKRVSGVMIGLMMVCMGNYMPKKLSGGCDSTCAATSSARSLQRYMGWTFVIAGLLYAGVWMLIDLDKTSLATMLTFPVAVAIIVIVRLVYLRMNIPTDAIGSVRHD